MRLERLVQFAGGVLLLAGWGVWVLRGAHYLSSISAWLWVGAFAVMCTPLLLLLVERVWTWARRR